jgi:hypothetical protein
MFPRGNDADRGLMTAEEERKLTEDIVTLSDQIEQMQKLKDSKSLDKHALNTLAHLKNRLKKSIQKTPARTRKRPDRLGINV